MPQPRLQGRAATLQGVVCQTLVKLASGKGRIVADAPVDHLLAGHPGTVFVRAGAAMGDWTHGVVTFATQSAGCEEAASLTAPLRAYHGDRDELLPAMARAGALRFWISRLWDFHLPREASLLKAHDPTHFERVLTHRLAEPWHPATV